MFSSLVLAAVLPVVAELGPLLKKGESAPAAVCSAFAVKEGPSVRVFTAAHCLHAGSTHLWLPGLVGNGLSPGQSQWKQVVALPAARWQVKPGHDLAWVDPGQPMAAWARGAPPQVGEHVTLLGYPQGKGPQRIACVYQGVLVLAGHIPGVRPSLRCEGLPSGPLQGMSGGVVLNARDQAVGVVVSGVRTLEGWAPGFEPLEAPATSRHSAPFWTVGTAVPSPAVVEWETGASGQVVRFEIRGPDRSIHSYWPPLPFTPPAGNLRR